MDETETGDGDGDGDGVMMRLSTFNAQLSGAVHYISPKKYAAVKRVK